MAKKNYVGKTLKIKEGTRVTRAGRTSARKTESLVTVRSQELARGGKIRVSWKSHGVTASTLI
ncbi:MAG: hypothetical protein E4H14_06210 [Candidatus Thorarchaeota archaeon]|nr:MAG: hypothetical protein E4H14_06210 [Candidatus Thorarchaeota archaeon]